MKSIYVTALIIGLSAMNISYADNAQYKPVSTVITQASSKLYYSANPSAYRSNNGAHEDIKEAFSNLRAEAWRKQKYLAHLVSKDNARKLALAKKPDIKIGMSAGEVLNSRWGEPAYKSSDSAIAAERWVYNNGSYLFLKNGRVTAIEQ